VDVGPQRADNRDYAPRHSPRPNRGTPGGVNRRRTFGRNRHDPARRSSMQPAPAVQRAPAMYQQRQHCDNCGPNNTHSTRECLQCTYCHKMGHTENVCRAKLHANQGKNNGANASGSSYVPMNKAPNTNGFRHARTRR
jgi:hypothetical protein